MKKLFRFAIVAFSFILFTLGFYCVLPTISWIFGGSFLEIAQHPIHVLFAGCSILVMLGIVFQESFNKDFYSKH